MKRIIKSLSLLKSPAFYRRLAMAVLLLLIVIRPTISSEISEREMSNLNVWLVVDATGSMVAKDVENGNKRRFEQTQDDAARIVSQLHGAKYSVIVQDFSTYSAVPMTFNADAVISSAPYFRPKDSYYTKPSDFTEVFTYVTQRITKYKQRYPERSNVVVFMSDGEDVSGKTIQLPQELTSLIDKAVVLGYGSANGSLIEMVGGFSEDDYDYTAITDEYVTYFGDNPNVSIDSEHRVISKINEANLQQIANTLHGDYYHRENGDISNSVITTLAAASIIQSNSSDATTNTGAEIYWFFAILLLALLAWEGEDILTRILAERNRKNV